MSNVNSVDSGSSVNNVPDNSQWDDSKHSKLVDLFHKHFSKVTKDVVSVGDDIKKGFEGVKQMVGDGYKIVEDFEGAAKNEGFKTAVKDVIENTLGGKNPLDGIATPQHMAAIKNDVTNLENIMTKLKVDGKPLEADIVIALEQGKGVVTDVVDLANKGMAIYGGNVNPEEFGQMLADLKDIKNCVEAGLQMNAVAAPNGGSKDSKSSNSGVTMNGVDNASNPLLNNLYALNMFKTQQVNTDNRTQERREQRREYRRTHMHERVTV